MNLENLMLNEIRQKQQVTLYDCIGNIQIRGIHRDRKQVGVARGQ